MGAFGANVYFDNQAGAVYQFASDSSIGWGNNAYGQGPPPFSNSGLVWKSEGTNTSDIWTEFVNNQGGAIRVDSGVLAIQETGFAHKNGGPFDHLPRRAESQPVRAAGGGWAPSH